MSDGMICKYNEGTKDGIGKKNKEFVNNHDPQDQ